jgi:2-oxoglutarate dehydrogenase E1 component
MFHLLRRQALVHEHKPLIVMTPKSWLYDHASSYSPLNALSGSNLNRSSAIQSIWTTRVERIIIASGKIYYEAEAERTRSTLAPPALLASSNFTLSPELLSPKS